MPTRRDLALGLVVAGAGSALAGSVAQAQAEVSEAEALEALDPWADALFTGDPAVVDQVLAEEFQILRSNGRGHDKASYLKALPSRRPGPSSATSSRPATARRSSSATGSRPSRPSTATRSTAFLLGCRCSARQPDVAG